MRRAVATIVLTAIALVGPASAAHATPPPPRPDPVEPIRVHVLWPLCTLVLGTGVCIPP